MVGDLSRDKFEGSVVKNGGKFAADEGLKSTNDKISACDKNSSIDKNAARDKTACRVKTAANIWQPRVAANATRKSLTNKILEDK